MPVELRHGDCREVMAGMEAESVDNIVTDTPYGLSLMGKKWDHNVPGVEFWREALRVAKPGAYLLAFGGTRTFHRLMVAIEDGGWEIQDTIMWVYGTGHPAGSLNISKAIDKAAGATREVVSTRSSFRAKANALRDPGGFQDRSDGSVTLPATDAARKWDGWGTRLKPAWEPIVVARKPVAGTIVSNVLRYGTGGINVNGCRIETDDNLNGGTYSNAGGRSRKNMHPGDERGEVSAGAYARKAEGEFVQPDGRWPANLVHDGSDDVTVLFPGEGPTSASRFFYCAKASQADRNEGLPEGTINNHPTVKPTALMRYLCRLVTPPGGLVLDPFCGSGSTGRAAVLEGFRFIGIEKDAEYVEIARARIDAALCVTDTAHKASPTETQPEIESPHQLPVEPVAERTSREASVAAPNDVVSSSGVTGRPLGRRLPVQTRVQLLPGLFSGGQE